MRNNVGAAMDATGRLVRYGLGHETKIKDDDPRSSDLIAITPVHAYIETLGGWTTVGVFTAYEVKPSDWTMPKLIVGRAMRDQPEATQRAYGQARFHAIVREAGGFAGFVTDPADIYRIMRRG